MQHCRNITQAPNIYSLNLSSISTLQFALAATLLKRLDMLLILFSRFDAVHTFPYITFLGFTDKLFEFTIKQERAKGTKRLDVSLSQGWSCLVQLPATDVPGKACSQHSICLPLSHPCDGKRRDERLVPHLSRHPR